MVRLNKSKLKEIELNKLYTQLDKSLSGLSVDKVDMFLRELLGPEERMMLAKRIAIIVMLTHGYSFYRIADTLKVGLATASRLSKNLETGCYDNLLKLLRKNKTDYTALLNILENILSAGGIMPSRGGLDRYRGIPR
ncbi:hypothetical protein A2837_03465 [Candidatus Kaiserbacteria bacterium RIFCSPHIGHO2_01_FULL_46_22]|uniref:TrpR like protein, YerC/YecD n=1 Tax=Candidatus Kaiserbacteria bacterium RIFCSPHIGHO2_01_FULL_46_22 TaxID=1798475 RepID=A0A1F6BXP7_9BACT|nr:MAG: hypothetical protein A2837_03465 [Candidatus Kaiserbacteria bacterium RIFCSPHIGHO2_01_FULL_46_22]